MYTRSSNFSAAIQEVSGGARHGTLSSQVPEKHLNLRQFISVDRVPNGSFIPSFLLKIKGAKHLRHLKIPP